jgi:hypothetical protein
VLDIVSTYLVFYEKIAFYQSNCAIYILTSNIHMSDLVCVPPHKNFVLMVKIIHSICTYSLYNSSSMCFADIFFQL